MQVAPISDMRWAFGWVVGGSAFVVGCMVPSFDGMQQESNATEAADSGMTQGAGGSGSSSPAPPPPGAMPSAPDGGAEASTDAAPAPKTFSCADASRRCAIGTEVCCFDGVSTTSCQSSSSTSSYACGGGYLRCSDSADCPGSTVCCVEDPPQPGQVATCRTSCQSGERVSCDPAKPTCNAGQTCTGSTGYKLHYCK